MMQWKVGGGWWVAHLFWAIAFLLIGPMAATNAQAPPGFTIDYLDSWPSNDQVKYIRVVIKPTVGVVLKDLDFYVVANSVGYQSGVSVSTKISMATGSTSGTGELFVPVCSGYNFTIHAELDGNLNYDRSDFARQFYNDYSFSGNTRDGAAPSFVFASSEVVADESTQFTVLTPKGSSRIPRTIQVGVNDSFPSLHDLESWYGQTPTVGGRKYMSINGFSSPRAAAMSLESLPSRWFGYEGLGALVISFDDLKKLAANNRGKLLAIERWVAASGRLVVLNCGKHCENAEDVLAQLGDSNVNFRRNRLCTIPGKAMDKDGIIQKIREETFNESVGQFGYQPYNQKKFSKRPKFDSKDLRLKDVIGSEFDGEMIAIAFESGQVVCASDSVSDWKEERPENVDRWGRLAVFLEETSRFKTHSHNVLGNATLRDFGFPEFAEPPRYVFESLILFYLLAVGPVAFFALKARNKLNLMFVVVPIISLVFCSSILIWAIFAEGFDTRVNLFTFTELNQQTGRQSTSSLSHIYSGMTPTPYRLKGSTYGFVNLPDGGRYQQIKWDDQSEELSSGEMRARTNHQLMTRCSNETEKKLAFAFKGSGDSTVATIRNDFDTRITQLVFWTDACDANEVWFCEEVLPGEIAEATRVAISDATRSLRESIKKRGSNTVFASEIKYSIKDESYVQSQGWNPFQSNLKAIGDLGIASKLNKMWRMNPNTLRSMVFAHNGTSYIALTDQSTNHETAIEDAVLETQIHVIRGVR